MNDTPLAAFHALIGSREDAPVVLERLDLLDWGQTVVIAGAAGDQPFELRYVDCRELIWRVYASNRSPSTPLVSFASGRDQHRSPAKLLTAHFGLSLFYGSVRLTTP